MRVDVSRRSPEEACGLVAGEGGRSIAVIEVANLLRSPVRFRMDPQEQIEALTRIEAQGWELLAIYHSHPAGPPFPSPTDLDEWYYPEAYALIWAPEGERWGCRAFQIHDSMTRETSLELIE